MAFAQTGAPRFFDEISRLERKKNEGELDTKSKQKLAELYFLTSRCPDLVALYTDEEQLSGSLCCACGQGCGDKTENETLVKLNRFRALLQKQGVAWKDKEVQSLWTVLKQRPEAKYLALRHLRLKNAQSLTAQERTLRQSLDQELGLLELGAH